MPIISLSTLTTLPTTKHWLTDWVTCSQACFYLCCVLKYIFITYQILNGYSCRLNAKNETNLYTFFFCYAYIKRHRLYWYSISFIICIFQSLYSEKPPSMSSVFWATLSSITLPLKKQNKKETASTTDNEWKTVLTFGLLNNTGFFFFHSVEPVMVTALTLILIWAPLSPRRKVRYPL